MSALRKRVGIIGAGEITRKSHLPVLMNLQDAQVAWVYDQRAPQAASLAAAYGVPALPVLSASDLRGCDVVLLAIPVNARAAYLDDLAAAGTAVLCEKPFATSRNEHEAWVSKFPPHALGAGYMRRYFRSAQLLRRIVDERLFGELLRIDIGEGNRSKGSGVDQSFLDDPRLGAARGVLTDLGSHSIDLALYLSSAQGFEVNSCTKVLDGAVDRKVSAIVSLTRSDREPRAPVDLHYVVSWLDRQPNRIVLSFEKGTVWSELSPGAEVFVGAPDDALSSIRLSLPTPAAVTYNQAFYLQWRDFLDGLSAGRTSRVSAGSALLTTSLVETLLLSGETAHD